MTTTTTTDAPQSLAVYLRVSTAEQKHQGTIENQRSAADRYLAITATTPYAWYADDGVSGTVPFALRPEGARLLADMASGAINTVLIWRLDRMGRNALAVLQVVETFEKNGVRLVSITENFDTGTPAGRLQLNMLVSIAQFEHESIAQRTSDGIANRLADTTWMGGHPPLGYRVEGKKSTARLCEQDTPDEGSGRSEADAVRLAWVLLTEQDWPCERIADHLDSLHIPTRFGARTGHGWAPNVVYQMFTNPIYKGERPYRQPDGTIITLPAPALVSVAAWDCAQATLARHRRSPVRSGARDYLLRGLMRCAECGELYTTSWTRRHDKDGKPLDLHRYYACSTRHFRMQHSHAKVGSLFPRDCVGVAVSAPWVEGEIWAEIEQFIRTPGPILLELAARAEAALSHAHAQRAQLAEVHQQLDAHQHERDKVVTSFRKGSIRERDLEHQLADLAREEATLVAQRDALATALTDATRLESGMQHARTLLQELHALLDEGEITPALKRTTVEKLVASIAVSTVDAGISARGRLKRRAVVDVTYTFDPTAAHRFDPQTAAQQRLFPTSSTCRRRHQLCLPARSAARAGRRRGDRRRGRQASRLHGLHPTATRPIRARCARDGEGDRALACRRRAVDCRLTALPSHGRGDSA